jgi:hypothetical protein
MNHVKMEKPKYLKKNVVWKPEQMAIETKIVSN